MVLVTRGSVLTREALSEALSVSERVLALSVQFDHGEAAGRERAWRARR